MSEQDKEIRAACREGLKMQFDVFKHLTTLSSGSILFLVTFLGKSGQQPLWRPLVAVSFVCFLLSSVSAVVVMLAIARTIRRNEMTDKGEKKPVGVFAYCTQYGFRFTVCAFGAGVLSLVLFGCKNL
jgi:hypothetical protein